MYTHAHNGVYNKQRSSDKVVKTQRIPGHTM